MNILFNSWDQKYKFPFGAIQKDTSIKWAIKPDSKIQEAILWLTKNSETPVAYQMKYNPATGLYDTHVKVTTSGLYFYYFMVKQNNEIYYVQRDNFGLGSITQNAQNLKNFQLTCYDSEVPEESWYQNGVAYQIFPDSFSNGLSNKRVIGRKKNSFIYATHDDKPYYIKDTSGDIVRWSFYGGNLAGIIKKIPYLKKLGVTILYLNPIFLASSNHRYDTVDFMKIDPMLGNEERFKELGTVLHKNGIHLILDGVFNHVGKDSIYFKKAITDKKSHYYYWFNFIEYPSKYRSWWGIKTLPEVNKANPSYENFIYGDGGVLAKWTPMHVDGWRLDVADELPMPFLRNIRRRLMKEKCNLMIGEVWEDASHKFVNGIFRPYVTGDNITATMNYPVRNAIIALLTAKNSAEVITAEDELVQIIENYPLAFLKNCLNNIGTHDTERIKTVLNDNEKLVAIAYGLMVMLPGVPCIYYGDEAGLSGNKDPDNRSFFPWGHENSFLEKKFMILTNFRKKHPALISGSIGFLRVDQNVNGIIRRTPTQTIIFIFNKGKDNIKLDNNQITINCLDSETQIQIKQKLAGENINPESFLLEVI